MTVPAAGAPSRLSTPLVTWATRVQCRIFSSSLVLVGGKGGRLVDRHLETPHREWAGRWSDPAGRTAGKGRVTNGSGQIPGPMALKARERSCSTLFQCPHKNGSRVDSSVRGPNIGEQGSGSWLSLSFHSVEHETQERRGPHRFRWGPRLWFVTRSTAGSPVARCRSCHRM